MLAKREVSEPIWNYNRPENLSRGHCSASCLRLARAHRWAVSSPTFCHELVATVRFILNLRHDLAPRTSKWPIASLRDRSKRAFDRLVGKRRPSADDVPHLRGTRSLDVHQSQRLAVERVLDQVVGAARDLNTAAAAMRLHAARQVDRLAPQIIDEFLATNDTGDHGTRIDSDAERELTATEPALCNGGLHIKREVDEGDGMVKPRARHAGGDHVAIANSLYLFQVVLLD